MSLSSIIEFLLHRIQEGVQIVLLALGLYYLVRFIRQGTRGARMVLGLAAISIFYFLIDFFNFYELKVFLPNITQSLLVFLCILFQPELRQMFAGIGDKSNLKIFDPLGNIDATIETLVRTAESLARQKIGAIVAVELDESLVPYEQVGRTLDAPLVKELLGAIFHPGGPLHDGGVVIRKGRIASAGCVFPLSETEHGTFGTRHRAALGLSENTDAIVVVVSEETGGISVARDGHLERNLSPDQLREILTNVLHPGDPSLMPESKAQTRSAP